MDLKLETDKFLFNASINNKNKNFKDLMFVQITVKLHHNFNLNNH